MAKKKAKKEKTARRWRLKLALGVFALLLGFTFIPGRFIPAGRVGDTYHALKDARDRAAGVATSTAQDTVARAAEEIAERRGSASTARTGDALNVCSFNVQFLGASRARDDAALASVVKEYDIVIVQELVSPPYPMTFPGGRPVKPDVEAAEFFEAMKAHGFAWWLSEEDTGTGSRIHSNGTNTEWWVAFYRPEAVDKAMDLPHGFLANDRSNHPDYERVPYAFAFRTGCGRADFVLISVHLKPGSGRRDKARRKHEIAAIVEWVDAHDETEKDFVILGDCNIENTAELVDSTPLGFLSLNDECRPTNTNVNGPKPYDHVFFRPAFSTEIDRDFDMAVIDLIEAMRPWWREAAPFPGDPYDHNSFRQAYTDHHPVVFRMRVPEVDDD
jgi:endonuclease/exonuclease/phosphatase family metal-dependent hydrolase